MSKLRHPERPDELETQNARMIQLIEGLVNENGKSPSSLQGVSLMRSDCAMLRKPVMYEPSIVIIAQGRKRGYLGGETFVYDQNNYLVLSVPLPFECDTEGTPEKPLLGLSINVDVPMLAELMLKTEPKKLPQENPAASQSIYCTRLDTKLADATNRLLETLYDKNEASILGHSIKREIVYRVLCGEQGSSLRSIATLDSRSSLINRALLRIHTE
ncbi:MAG: AraC family transcriptional regulator [Candidatus Obscuribacterales bacterium]|nr:AraC family transcriptional regulator [Candidatus Obscuribacterales bacterium]